MRKKYKVGLIVIGVLLLGVISLGVLRIFYNDEEEKREVNVTSVISNISDYGYTLDDRDTDYMKEVFSELENILEALEIDYHAYAEALAKLFVIDFYTLENKINKYDVGSLEYILSSSVESFRLKAQDTIYRDVIDNTYRDRIQDLPEITNVEVVNTEDTTFTLNDEEVDAIKVEMNYEYKEDLGYDTEGTIYLVRNDVKLEIVSYSPSIEEV
ncbi:MAG TPA: hypothetical protein IAB49_02205 [Candidatus Caccenecus avistercoris]|nr:hypothetical protein [Candidatus Caccenecus avistercoris]